MDGLFAGDKVGNLSGNVRETADRQIVVQTEDTGNIDCDETARQAKGGWVRRVCGLEPKVYIQEGSIEFSQTL